MYNWLRRSSKEKRQEIAKEMNDRLKALYEKWDKEDADKKKQAINRQLTQKSIDK